MIPSKIHIMLRVLVLSAVFFFSSGFTAIVKYCSMNYSSECCCTAEESQSQNNDRFVSEQNPSCLIKKTIGGLSETKATITSESPKDAFKFLAFVNFVNNVLPRKPVLSTTSFQTDVGPPPGNEIYIRDAALLI